MNRADRECTEDWVVRDRRSLLSELEKQVLVAHLAQCASCRAVSALSALFEAIPDKQPGDEQLIALVAERASRPGRPLAARGWTRMAVAAALIACVGGAAAAATWSALKRRAEHARRDQAVLPMRMPPASPERTCTDVGEAPAAPEPRGEARAGTLGGVAPPAVRPAPSRGARPSRPMAPVADAASLFSEANLMRRSGDLQRAVGLYQALRRHFPDSSEASLSALSEGELLLALAEPTGALAAYDDYLARHPTGTLAEEALFGRARCLGKLGRLLEERHAWEELVRRFPSAASRPAANKRLEDLAR